ncbi:MAG: PAS domain S-box protein, partial [Proteobacteria bacterium]|nr:PAS domain S-box protein [Pseudomonadota bacterium]
YLAFCSKAAEEGDAYAGDIQTGVSSVLSGQSDLFRLEFSSRSGPALRWFLLEVTPRGRGSRGAVVSHLDITAKKRAERRLSRNETRYRTLIEALHEGLLTVRKGGIMAYLNDRFAGMLGWPKATLLGRRPEEYVTAESLARLVNLLGPGSETRHAEEIIWNHASGRHVYTLVSSSKTLDEEGNVIGTFAVVTDTTERKGLESQLLQSQKLEAIGQLAAGIAHEINTPAQYVGNNVQFIKGAFTDIFSMCSDFHQLLESAKSGTVSLEQVLAVEKAMADHDIEYLSTEVPGAIAQTLEGVERISTIVRSVKQFAHPGAAVMAPADLNEAMQSTVTVSRNEWKYVAELTTELDDSLPAVVCMIGEINQVVLNLIVNAAHAIADAVKNDPERKGLITLSTRLTPPWAEIRVTDTGTGIPPAVQAKIFDPFFTTKEVGRGTGQGLTISRSIVMEKHHGQLFFETEPGVGTTFVVRLPLEQNEEREA